ncbi:MAG: 2-oxoacid:acceptor oxidoreductase subunit alpha [Actinobacteria bacterium]|nr:MAG: 2-oxoacid:acceptor oxidoreductase subunit alpha [Actinomycetota bacterium]TMK46867.1 MAG: 2-oxoacid:acceptor oxidoreductase subunit alpha [Actinomycetota bacterium]TMK66190.1 MAG: 2-oxoacid:acceptor oxidoreductase subunit alpha [Actinomycetota bacterium]
MPKDVEEKDRIVIRFAGDSGDGMQLTGDRFTNATAVLGNDLATLPDFPAEIRAPAGTVHGVSAFQIQFASEDITTPGDHPNVLVAMNPAALKADLHLLQKGGTVIVNEDAFVQRNVEKAGFSANPLEDGTLEGYQVYKVPMTSITVRAVEELGLSRKEAERSKNMFALGLVSWMYGRPIDVTLNWLHKKFGDKPQVYDANVAAFKAGYNFGETTELFAHSYQVKPAPAKPGTYRNVSGAQALALGLVAASQRSALSLFYASYPITPASELLHELSRLKNFGVRTLQAEDEIAAANVALGAAFVGQLGVTGTSGPGMDLKAETIGLAVALELPMVIVDVQRAGPSTGMPTKTEAADLLLAMYGRHGESPMPIVAASSPSNCFDTAIEAVRIAVKYRTPVILLSDTFLSNSSEPWLIPDADTLPTIDPGFATGPNAGTEFLPYLRDENLARPWAIPGTPGLRHRIGGLEKEDGTGDISYEPENHERMTELRAAKVAGIAKDVPALGVDDPDGDATLLVLGWGSTWGTIRAAARRIRDQGKKVATAHLSHLNPFPSNIEDVVRRYPKVLIPEMNSGQLALLIRGRFLVDAKSYAKVQGLPIFAEDLEQEILKVMAE